MGSGWTMMRRRKIGITRNEFFFPHMLYSLFVIIVTIIRRKEFTNNIKSTI